MILYNITICIDKPLEPVLTGFVKGVLVPRLSEIGANNILFSKIRQSEDVKNALTGSDTESFAVQVRLKDADALENLERNLAALLQTAPPGLLQSLQIFCTTLDIVHDPLRRQS